MNYNPFTLSRLHVIVLTLFVSAGLLGSLRAEHEPGETLTRIEKPSPDGRYAFLFTATPDEKTYELIEKKSGKVLQRVAESDPDGGPSSRFIIQGVLWKADSSAFALTVAFFKRGNTVLVFQRTNAGFEEVALPELEAEIPVKLTQGKDLQHVNTLDSETALRWLKNGALVLTVENAVDGNDGMVTATRTVELAFNGAEKAKIVNSSIKYRVEK